MFKAVSSCSTLFSWEEALVCNVCRVQWQMLQLSPGTISSYQCDSSHQHTQSLTVGHSALWSGAGWLKRTNAINHLFSLRPRALGMLASEPSSGSSALPQPSTCRCTSAILPLFFMRPSKTHLGSFTWLPQEVSVFHCSPMFLSKKRQHPPHGMVLCLLVLCAF